MDIRQLLLNTRAGSSNRQIAQDMRIDRRTVSRYREWAEGQGMLEGALPSLEDLDLVGSDNARASAAPEHLVRRTG